jgi:hypothetical protein
MTNADYSFTLLPVIPSSGDSLVEDSFPMKGIMTVEGFDSLSRNTQSNATLTTAASTLTCSSSPTLEQQAWNEITRGDRFGDVATVPRVVSAVEQTTSGGSDLSDSMVSNITMNSPSTKKKDAPPTANRRQKRLERNRESARLSRRRRKQYLEVLEEKVTQLSYEMDLGRRQHVSQALECIHNLRSTSHILHPGISRTSNELRVAHLFGCQQLQSLALPPSTKFIMWLTLQNDTYYRGGRAASERLSAARIGERVSVTIFGNK